MYIYYLYGFIGDQISDAREIIKSRLDIKLEEKESSYHGGLYYHYKSNKSESCLLKNNIDPIDGEAAELDYPEYAIIFYVDKTDRPEYFRDRLLNENKFVLLQTRTSL